MFISDHKDCDIFKSLTIDLNIKFLYEAKITNINKYLLDFDLILIQFSENIDVNYFTDLELDPGIIFIIKDDLWLLQDKLLNFGALDVLLHSHCQNPKIFLARINRALKYIKLLHDKKHCADLFERELKIKSRQLLHANKLVTIGRIASQLAHDFNNQLMTISGFSELSLKNYKREYLTIIKNAADKSSRLIRDILSFSRKPITEFKNISLNNLVTEKVKLLSQVIGQKFKIRINLAKIKDNIYADPNQLEQVIFNLVLNSRDAMKDGGIITISTSNTVFVSENFKNFMVKKGTYLVLSIFDTGEGIDPNQIEKIFEPYYTTKDHSKGTGLGLVTVFGIMKQHNGYIDVTSNIGKGTRFDLYFPFVIEKEGVKNDCKWKNKIMLD